MENHIEKLLNRISLSIFFLTTLSLLHLFSHPSSCPHSHPHPQTLTLTLTLTPFPTSSCSSSSRPTLPPSTRLTKLLSSRPFRRRVRSFSSLFLSLRRRRLLSNSSRVLCVSAGAGHEVAALRDSGVGDVTGVEVVDFPPLVRRADPHNLPFFDEVFDLGFSAGLGDALFPGRFVGEMERTVRKGGVVVLAVGGLVGREDVEGVEKLFVASDLVEVRDFSLDGSMMTLVVMRKSSNGTKRY